MCDGLRERNGEHQFATESTRVMILDYMGISLSDLEIHGRISRFVTAAINKEQVDYESEYDNVFVLLHISEIGRNLAMKTGVECLF